MSDFFNIFVEMELSGEGGGWTVISDVASAVPISWKYGIDGHGASDRVAQTGSLTFALDNSEDNSGHKLGYYSPGHANCRAGFAMGIGVRLRLNYGPLGDYYKWRGVIDSIAPIPNIYGERKVAVACVDYMDELARASLRGVPVQLNQRSDQLFSTIIANMPKQPPALQIGFGMEQYAYALDGARDEGLPVMTELQKLAASEIGFIFPKGDAVQGGTLVFEDRRKRGVASTSVASFSNFNDIVAARKRDNVINRVLVTVHPRRKDPAPATFDPMTVAGLTCWVKADSITGLNDGDPISNWLDSTGLGHNFTATTTLRPQYRTGAKNGLPGVLFDGVNDLMTGSLESALITAAAHTMFVVLQAPSIVSNKIPMGDANSTLFMDTQSGTHWRARWNNSGVLVAASQAMNPGAFSILTTMHSGGTTFVSDTDSRDSGLGSGSAQGNLTPLTGAFTLGGTTGVGNFNAYICEVLIFNVAVAENDRKNIESYLAHKYDITIPYPLQGLGILSSVIFKLDETQSILKGTSLPLKCPYKDQDQTQARIGAVDQVDPLPTTDYLFNTLPDGTGVDITSQVSIVTTSGGNAADLVITNNGPFDGYLTFLQLRGVGIYDEGEVVMEAEDTALQTQFGENLVAYDMPYQSSPAIAFDAAYYLLSQNKSGYTIPESASFIASQSDALMRHAILREPSDRIDIVDPLLAINGPFFIQSIDMSVDGEGILRCSWGLVPAGTDLYWILDSATQSQLDQTTKLAYGLWNRYWILGVAAMGSDTRLS